MKKRKKYATKDLATPTHTVVEVRLPKSLEIKLLRIAAWAEVPMEDVVKVIVASHVVANADSAGEKS